MKVVLDRVLDHALAYAARGWPIFPIRPGHKEPLTDNGFHDASTDPAVIEAWWKRWPNANVGGRTGDAFSVLDIDGPVGEANLTPYHGGYFHTGPVAYTGKGWHYLFEPSEHATTHGKPDNFIDKVDFQSHGAYVVLPPSLHPNGQFYRWDAQRGLDLPLAPITDWLEDLLTSPTEPVRPARELRYRMDIFGNLTPITTAFEATRPPILEVADDLGLLEGSRRRGNRVVMARCFNHDDSTPSLALYTDTNTFWCFGPCQGGGDSHQLAKQKFGYTK